MRSRPLMGNLGCSLIFQNGTVVPLLSVDPGVKFSIRVIIGRKNGTSALREYLSRNSLSMGRVCVRLCANGWVLRYYIECSLQSRNQKHLWSCYLTVR